MTSGVNHTNSTSTAPQVTPGSNPTSDPKTTDGQTGTNLYPTTPDLENTTVNGTWDPNKGLGGYVLCKLNVTNLVLLTRVYMLSIKII